MAFVISGRLILRRAVVGFLGYSRYSSAAQVGRHTHDENIDKLKLSLDLAGLVQESLNLEDRKSQVSKKFEKSIENLGGVKHGASLAQNLANLVEESYNLDESKPVYRVQHKRLLELRIKKRVKE